MKKIIFSLVLFISFISCVNAFEIDVDKIDLNDILIIHDDLDMPVGKLKLKENGTSGGHNGIKNIIVTLGSNGSRFKNQKAKGYLANRLANKFLTMLSNLFTRQKLTDMETCYKCFAREVIQSVDIQEKRFGFEPEITAKISDMRIRIHEVPISYNPRTNEEGKKIGMKDGIRAIYCIVRYH